MLASTGGLLVDVDVSARPWFSAGSRGPYVGDVHEAQLLAERLPAPADGAPLRFVDLAAPVYDQSGRLAGVLGAHLSWRWASDVGATLRSLPDDQPGAEALVLDQDGLVILGSPELQGQVLELASVAAARAGGSGTVAERWPDGSRYLVGYHQGAGHRSYPGLGWLMLVRVPVDVAFAPIVAAERQIIVGNLLFAGAIAAIAWALSARTVRPLRQIADAADRIREQGDAGPIPLVRGHDEISRLASSLDALVRSQQAQQADLEAANEQLQHELEERRRAEAELRSSQERFRLLVEGVQDYAIFMLDPDGYVVSWNAGAERIKGYRADEILGQHLAVFYPQDASSELAAAKLKRARHSGSYAEEGLRIRRDGSRFWASAVITPLYDDGGELRGFAKITRDISERVRADARLRASQERLAGIVESAMDAIVTVDASQQIVLFNRTAEEVFGYSAGEVVGRPLDQLIPARHHGAHRRHIATFQPTNATARAMVGSGDLVGLRRDGREFPIEASISRICIDGEALYTAIVRDISARRQLEAQFLQAQKMETVGRLAGGVAHDFNNLLTAISGYAEFAHEALPEGDPTRADLQEVLQAVDRAAGLTRQLLAFSRQQPFMPRVVGLNGLVLGLSRLLGRLIGADMGLALRLSSAELAVRIDPGQIEQVVVNLVVNARDAMSDGGAITIRTLDEVRYEAVAAAALGVEPGVYALLSVHDTGVGILPEARPHLFEPFYTTKEAGKGTGLGLAICYSIVNQHGGAITYESAPGSTSFSIHLPVAADGGVEVGDVPLVDLPRGRETILLVEDDPAVLAITSRALRSLGYRVVTASDGVEALGLIDGGLHTLDLVLTDTVMPQMGGPALVAQLRGRQIRARTLLMSGTSGAAPGEHTIDLRKPFNQLELAQVVRRALDAG